MKDILSPKFLAPFLGILFSFALLLFDGCLAVPNRLIDSGDKPITLTEATPGWREGSLREAALVVINFFLFFLGLLCTGMVIFGGFLYMTAAGDDGQTDKGKKVLQYAIIGIIIILLSFAIVNTVTQLGGALRTET